VIHAERDDELLVGLLDEVVYRLDTAGEVPVDLRLAARAEGLRAFLGMADVSALPSVGAAPKAVTLHGLSLVGGREGWRCSVTLDV
jgi:SHS2 domain-containing protein